MKGTSMDGFTFLILLKYLICSKIIFTFEQSDFYKL